MRTEHFTASNRRARDILRPSSWEQRETGDFIKGRQWIDADYLYGLTEQGERRQFWPGIRSIGRAVVRLEHFPPNEGDAFVDGVYYLLSHRCGLVGVRHFRTAQAPSLAELVANPTIQPSTPKAEDFTAISRAFAAAEAHGTVALNDIDALRERYRQIQHGTV